MQRLTNMYFTFAGKRSDQMGIKLTDLPKRQAPALDVTKKKLPKRHGFEAKYDGSYDGIRVTQEIFIPSNSNINSVKNWLRGTGDLVFSDDPDYAYDAIIMSAYEFGYVARHLEGQKARIIWECQPWRHEVNEQQIILTSGSVFNGHGHENASPIIKVEGSGNGILMVNGNAVELTLTYGVPIYLDCDIGKSFVETNNIIEFAGSMVRMSDDWPELRPHADSSSGYNNVNWTGGITRVTFTPRWRCV